jgi:hypothetical protein
MEKIGDRKSMALGGWITITMLVVFFAPSV